MDDASTIDDARTVGARIRVLREWRGMHQRTLADLVGLSQPHLSKIERGRQALDKRSHIASFARALRVSEADIIGGPHLSADPVQSAPHAGIPALRVALETNTITSPACDRARPLEELVREVADRIEPMRRTCDYATIGDLLPGVIDELYVHIAAPEDEYAYRVALETLIDACNVAAFTAKVLSYPDLAHVIAVRADEAATILGDPVQRGKTQFLIVQTMPREGWRRTLNAAERAANTLEPHVHDPLGIQTLGMLTLSAAMSAAACKDHDGAKHWLDEATSLAGRIDDDPDHAWQGFSSTNVNIWRIGVEVERGQSGPIMLDMAKSVHGEKLGNYHARKADFIADVGRGLAREKKTRSTAVQWLRRAEDVAPQRIRNSQPVRHTVEVLHTQALDSAVSVELRGMMARMSIPH
jgi:transcriptional regulator with XRE-family HTH domain